MGRQVEGVYNPASPRVGSSEKETWYQKLVVFSVECMACERHSLPDMTTN